MRRRPPSNTISISKRARATFRFQSFSISFGSLLVVANAPLSVCLSVCLSPSRRWNTRFSIDIACCIAARFAFHLQDGSERRNRERHRKLTVIAFNVTRARTDQSQLLEVTESRGRRRNQLLSGFWWSGRVREPLFAKTYGGMFLSFVRPRRGFREDNDDLKRKKKKEKGFGFCESLYPYKWK